MTNGRCSMHGGKSTGPRNPNWRSSIAAACAGRKAYIARLHAVGLRAPGGRPRKLSHEQRGILVAKAVAKIDGEIAGLPAVAKPWEEMTPGEQLQELTVLGMTRLKAILLRPIDYDNPLSASKQERLQSDIGLGLMSRLIRVDDNRLRDKRETGFADMLKKLLETK